MMDPKQWDIPVPLKDRMPAAFPISAYPQWLASYVLAEAEATQTPVDLPAVLVLAVLATALAKKYRVKVRGDWVEPLNGYFLVALDPGNRKTPVFRNVARPIEDFEAHEAARLAETIKQRRIKREILSRKLKKLHKDALILDDERDLGEITERLLGLEAQVQELPELHEPRLNFTNITPEALTTRLQEQGGRISILTSEAVVFDIMGGLYQRCYRAA